MDNLIGKTIGDFEIIELIGRGGMSSVYLASDNELERHVALKIPHERFLDDQAFVKRFNREAKAMARLCHPNIVQIYSVGSQGDLPFFAMEYVQGQSLENLVREKSPLDVGFALKYISQIASAIEYAHKRGIVHRDIKPANILVDSSERLLVTDFGVSKMLSDDATQDTVGFVGTPQYMSPEQCGQGTLDHRTDIYSMGALLFEMLTGQPAFSSSSPAEVIKMQLFDMPEIPAELKDRIPETIQAVLSKMLAKDPEERYPDVRSLLKELNELDYESCGATAVSSTASTLLLKDFTKPKPPIFAARKGIGTRRTALAVTGLALTLAAAVVLAFTWQGQAGLNLDSLTQALRNNRKWITSSSNPEQAHARAGNSAAISERNAPATVAARENETVPVITLQPEVQAAPESEWGTVVIQSEPPGAEVALDSEGRGLTPVTLPEVKPGRHLLVMKLDGYPVHSEEAIVDAAAPLEVFHDFKAAKQALIPSGSLTIDSEPAGALVSINGEEKGKTRLELPNLRSAKYTIVLEMEGYQPIEKRVNLLPDENLRISLNLIEEVKYGSLSVLSRPKGAEVLLDGVSKGSTPLVLQKIPVGQYKIKLAKKGYKPYHADFTCEVDVMRTIEAALEMTPKFAAMESMIAGDRYTQMGELARAAEAYNRAMSLDPNSPVYQEKLTQAKRSLVKREIKDLLSSYKNAYDNENAELLASLLDAGDSVFLSDQVANAESLFREFDNISLTLSSPRLSVKGPGEVEVELHLDMSAEFAETGMSTDLLTADRTLLLRRDAEAGWKICAIQ